MPSRAAGFASRARRTGDAVRIIDPVVPEALKEEAEATQLKSVSDDDPN